MWPIKTTPPTPAAPSGGSPTDPDGSSAANARAWLAFTTCGAIWGSTFLVISIGNDAMAPVWAAALRLMLATVLLTAWGAARGVRIPRGAALRAALGYGLGQFGINFPLLYWAERIVPSGLAAVFYATIPLSTALLTHALGMEQLTAGKMFGAILAFGGVTVLFSSSLRGDVPLIGLLTVFTAATMAGIGTVLLKRGPRQSPIGANAVGSALGAVITLAISFAIGEPHVLPTTPGAAFPLLYLTIAGSLGAFVIMSWLVNHWSVTRTSYVSVIVPVLALGLGALFRKERLTWLSLVGSTMVLVGLVIGMRGGTRRADRRT
ncbi:MAG: EamA family transporter [Pseudomonadota bacterium]